MKLETIKYCSVIDANVSVKPKDNNISIITDKVKITAKYKQTAQNKKEKIENIYNSSIDKGAKKRNFYNKHK